jgi:hypothetical protein
VFRASLCPSSGEQEQDWLKLHVKMPGCAGCGCVEPGVGSVHFLKAVVQKTALKMCTLPTPGSTQPQPAQPGIFT